MKLDEALTGLEMATLLEPSEPEVRAAGDRAREIFVELEATSLLAQLEAALARPSASADGTTPVEVGSLSTLDMTTDRLIALILLVLSGIAGHAPRAPGDRRLADVSRDRPATAARRDGAVAGGAARASSIVSRCSRRRAITRSA